MTPGQFFFDSDFQFRDGEIGRKIFVVLSDGGCGYYVVAKTTSRGRLYRNDYGCQSGNRFPCFFLPQGSCCLRESTWICLDEFYEFDRRELLQKHFTGTVNRLGALKEEMTLDVVTCAINCPDVTTQQESVLQGTQRRFRELVLRQQLNRMTEDADVEDHPRILAEVSRQFGNAIVIQQSAVPLNRYTCLVHVLNFAECAEYVAIASRGIPDGFAGARFGDWLLAHDCLDTADGAGAVGQLVFYLRDSNFAHAGLVTAEGRITSKWGVGQLVEHALWEVPECYGENVLYFHRPTDERALELFHNYLAAIRVSA
jgi:hypothetical protein